VVLVLEVRCDSERSPGAWASYYRCYGYGFSRVAPAPWRTLLKIVFRESGGFAPVFRGCELDTDALPAREAAQVQALVEASGLVTLGDRRVESARDVRLYAFRFETETGAHEVTLDQLSVPPSARPLLDLLRARSRDLLPED